MQLHFHVYSIVREGLGESRTRRLSVRDRVIVSLSLAFTADGKRER